MFSARKFLSALEEAGISFFCGVPDSLLKRFCQHIHESLPPERHVIAANEGTAVSIAAGTFLVTGKIPCVYMQNSGIGNAINPLLSLVDPEVYGIPMLLIIGWRGEPGKHDEPQHKKQGAIMECLLSSIDIPYLIASRDSDEGAIVRQAISGAQSKNGPFAILVRDDTFAESQTFKRDIGGFGRVSGMSRFDAIKIITEFLDKDTVIVATTGHISRELYESRKAQGRKGTRDFLTVGSMGHASQIALGAHLASSNMSVVCLDGDGAVIMHMGGLATAGTMASGNYAHVVLNNGAHDSVGGQPTVGFDVSLTGVARSCGYKHVLGPVLGEQELIQTCKEFPSLLKMGSLFVEVVVDRRNPNCSLARPSELPRHNKQRLMDSIKL